MTKEEVLQQCTIEGMVVKLPEGQLERKLYQDVAKALELIGGKWKGGKVMGFVFPHDPTDLLAQIANGEKRNLKKEYQFFETSPELADHLVWLANIPENCTPVGKSPNFDICEPSAGQGAIIRAIHRKCGEIEVYAFELMDINRSFLSKIPKIRLSNTPNFLEYPCNPIRFNRIIANPPFRNNQDIDHVYKMWDCLKLGGRIVTIVSKHWQNSSNKKEVAFRKWLDERNVIPEDVEAGAFKESGTNIATCILVIDKN